MPAKQVQQKLDALPAACGVYLFKDKRHKVVYVGKAVNLRSRVRSYFQPGSSDERVFVEHMMPKVADIDWVLVASEKEALILENNLIKQFRPRFNINLKDDKTFLSIRLDRRKPFPRLELVRRYTEDGALYFGPYSSAGSARETLRLVNAVFPLRKCADTVFRGRTRPCLYYQIGRCLGPCCGLADDAAYGELLDEVELFLRGRNQELAERLRAKMLAASERREYELAARYRDQVRAVERTLEKQTITSARQADRDVFGYYKQGDAMRVQALLVRRGRLEDVPQWGFDTRGLSAEAAFASFLEQFYSRTRFIPPEVLVPVLPPDPAPLTEWLRERRGGKVELLCPQRGDKARLLQMAMENAESAFRAAHATERDRSRTLEGLQQALGLSRVPSRIECYDISNIGGAQAVGSQATFDDGAPNKARYRRYKIKTVEGSDDFAMMSEVLARRLQRGLKEGDLPDLIVLDGGKGQLGAVRKVFRQLDVVDVDLVALAKGRDEPRRPGPGAPRKQTDERVFVPGRAAPVVLPHDSSELYLLQRVRDEAHRFAVAYHRKLRRQPYKHAVLDSIPGIGPARKKALVAHFGSVRAIRKASVDELQQVDGIAAKQARAIHEHLHGGGVSEAEK
ncbi:excinuclease ABC subunit UvrC [bacterium]|nr:excinuclease ABC subunit UvrC [bacterium]